MKINSRSNADISVECELRTSEFIFSSGKREIPFLWSNIIRIAAVIKFE
jgi:hypothetical protein